MELPATGGVAGDSGEDFLGGDERFVKYCERALVQSSSGAGAALLLEAAINPCQRFVCSANADAACAASWRSSP